MNPSEVPTAKMVPMLIIDEGITGKRSWELNEMASLTAMSGLRIIVTVTDKAGEDYITGFSRKRRC